MYFKDIIGHDGVKQNLINIVKSGRISHAYIFSGPEGVGKLRTAKAFGASVLCENFTDDICGVCKNCRLSIGNANPDLISADYSIGSDGKEKASVSVDAMREFKKDVYLKPFGGKRKVYIIDRAEKMTPEAQNALLKILEEPPEFITIILVCSNISKILSTIISRTVQIKFSYLTPENIEIYLNKYYNDVENKKIHARICNGSIGTLIKNIEDGESLIFRKKVTDAMTILCTSPLATSINNLFTVFMDNKDKKDSIISFLSFFVFDCMYCKAEQYGRIINTDIIEDIRKICRNVTPQNIYATEKILEELNKRLISNSNYKLAVTDALIKIREEIHG